MIRLVVLLLLAGGSAAAWWSGAWWRPALWITGQYDRWVQATQPPQMAALLLAPRSHMLPLYALLLLALGVFYVYARGKTRKRSRSSSKTDADEIIIQRRNNPPLVELDLDLGAIMKWRRPEPEIGGRLYWRFRPPADSMKVDGLYLPRTGKRSHGAWYAPTGGGKSSAVAMIRVDGARPTLAAMPDKSDPVREAAERLGKGKYFIWTACESDEPIDFLIGTHLEVAERLSTVFRWGGTGAVMRAARRATAGVIKDIDDLGRDRWLLEIGHRLDQLRAHDKNMQLALGLWVDRFLDVAEQFDKSMRPGGRDVALMLRQGMTVVIDVEAFAHPGLGGDVVAFGLAEGRRSAPLVRGGFRLIFEEAGQLGERIDLADPFHRAGRRHGIAVDDLTQAETDLVMKGGNNGIVANLGIRVYFSQEEISLQKTAANRLGLKYTALDPGVLKDFHAYIVSGNVRRLVHFPKPPALRDRFATRTGGGSTEPGVVYLQRRVEPGRRAGTSGTGTEGERPRRVMVTEVKRDGQHGSTKPVGPIALPGASAVAPKWIRCMRGDTCDVKGCKRCRRTDIWARLSGTWNDSGCHLWPEDAGRNKEYGKVNYLNVGGWSAHFLFWAWKVMDDHEQGRDGDLERFYQANQDVPRFRWPDNDDELIVLRALKTWMARPDQNRPKLSLSIDHCCPGWPNPLCQNWRHHQLVADEPGREGSNSKLRWQRRRGSGRLAAEGIVSGQEQA